MSHVKDMIAALNNIPKDEVFYVRRTKEAGYPHKDASKILQHDAILGTHVGYADPSYDGKGIRYIRKP